MDKVKFVYFCYTSKPINKLSKSSIFFKKKPDILVIMDNLNLCELEIMKISRSKLSQVWQKFLFFKWNQNFPIKNFHQFSQNWKQ